MAARIVIFMLLVLFLSLYAAYTANIVALLQSTSDSIKNLKDLMNSPLKIGIHDIVYNRYFFGVSYSKFVIIHVVIMLGNLDI